MRSFTLLFTTGLVSSAVAQASYMMEDDYEPSSFFSMFDFFTSADPTNGYVQYVDQSTAQTEGLINTNNGAAYMGVDHTNVASGSGRSSVRLTSKKSYNQGLVILDVAHMPGGICGTWPAFWMVGPDWPNDGEIDIIEGVNSQNSNSMTLHTDAGCSITNNGQYTGTLTTSNCNVAAAGQSANAGCQINTPNTASYGTGFNSQGGGVYATEWTSETISIWFFPRDSVPSDITNGNPDPAGWGVATSAFSGGCDIDQHFQDLQIVFDTTFCGDWAGNVWSTDSVCAPNAATCQAFVQNNPSAFVDAYWSINSLKVYQSNGATSLAEASALPNTSAAITSAASSTYTQSQVVEQATFTIAATGKASDGAAMVSTAVVDDPKAKAAPTVASANATTSGSTFPQVSPQNTSLLVMSLSSTVPPTMAVNGNITAMGLTMTPSITNVLSPFTVTSTISNVGSYVAVNASNASDFPSAGESQTASIPVPVPKQHHRHTVRHQKKRYEF